MKKLLAMLAALVLLAGCAVAELSPQAAPEEETAASGPVLESGSLAVGESSVTWPKVTGMADEALQQEINDRLLELCGVQQLILRLAQVMSAPEPLTADWQGILEGGVLSVRLSARGPVEDLRATETLRCACIDLRTGEDITLAELFTDEEAAREALETYMTETVAPGLSGYLDAAELLPLPEQWYIDAWGITFCYPIGQYGTLSERAGTVCVRWYELRELLRLGEDTVLSRIGAEAALTSDAAAVADWVSRGALPGIPVKLGDSMAEAVDVWRRLTDPDLCEAGRLYWLEEDCFRGTALLTDRLSRELTDSVVEGLRSERCNLGGLITGVTTQSEWRALLGEPESTVTLTAEQAEAWRLTEGTSDYYIFGEYRLRLHCDAEGVLVTVMVTG